MNILWATSKAFC